MMKTGKPGRAATDTGRTRTVAAPSLYLALAYGALVIYGTLFPLSEWTSPGVSPWSLIWQRGFSNTSRSDLLTNLLVYMPLGLLLMHGLSRHQCRPCMLVLVTLCSALLSVSLEFLQAHLPGRVPSMADIILNTAGGLAGALLALGLRPDSLFGEYFHRLRHRYILPGTLANLGLLALFLWALSQLSPLVPSLDLGNLRHGLKPLWTGMLDPASIEWLRVAEYTLSVAAIGLVLSTLLKLRYRAMQIMVVFALAVMLLKVPVLGRQLSLEAVIGLVIGLAVAARMHQASITLRLTVAASAILLMLVASGVHVPAGNAGLPTYPFNWVPFRSHLSNSIIGVIDIIGDIWPFVTLSYIAQTVFTGLRSILAVAGAVLVFALVLMLEWYQQYLPGRSADITDAILASLAWLLPWYIPRNRADTATAVTETRPTPAGAQSASRVLVPLLAVLAVVVGILTWSQNDLPAEHFVDERKLALLPAPEDLPAVSLPAFRYSHPRLPAPRSSDIQRLRQDNPAYLRNHSKRAANGTGKSYSSFVTAFVEPGSINLDNLYQTLMELQISWRGHEQAKQIAVAYDWLYDQWSEEQRNGLREKLVENAHYLIDRIREKQRLSPYNVYLYNSPFQALVATALALYGDDPRGEAVMRYTYDYWINRVLPVWRQVMGRNGGWHEGGEYVGIGIGQAVYQVPAMWREATGEDLFSSEPGIRGFLDFLVYRTRPDGTHFRWGDGAYFNRRVPDRVPLAIEYRHAAAYSLRCPRRLEPTSWPWGPLPDESLCDPLAKTRLPLSHYFDGIGMLIARDDWTDDSTYVTFKAGDNFWSHTHLDQGAFTIFRGGPLAIDSGAYGGGSGYGSDHHMNYAYQSIAHNTITVKDPRDNVPAPGKDNTPRKIANDGGQRRVGSGWGIEAAPLDLNEWQAKQSIYDTGHVAQYLQEDGLSILVTDITAAYTNELSGEDTFSHRTRRVERLWRTFAYDARDNVVVVFDQLRTTGADFEKRWLLHTLERPEYANHRFSVDVPASGQRGRTGGRLEGHVLLPRQAQARIVGGQDAAFLVDGKNYIEATVPGRPVNRRAQSEPGEWRLEISPAEPREDNLFLVVMLPGSPDARPTHRVRLMEDGQRVGCEIIGPERTTRWWFEPGVNGLDLEVQADDAPARLHRLWPQDAGSEL